MSSELLHTFLLLSICLVAIIVLLLVIKVLDSVKSERLSSAEDHELTRSQVRSLSEKLQADVNVIVSDITGLANIVCEVQCLAEGLHRTLDIDGVIRGVGDEDVLEIAEGLSQLWKRRGQLAGNEDTRASILASQVRQHLVTHLTKGGSH